MPCTFSWDFVYDTMELTLKFVNSFEKFAACGHSADRIKSVRAALKSEDVREFELLMTTLNANVSETMTLCDTFQEKVDIAAELVYTAAKDVQNKATKTKRIRSRVSWAAFLGGLVAMMLFQVPAIAILGLVVSVGGGVAIAAGILAADRTNYTAVTELSQSYCRYVSWTASLLITIVKHLSRWINELHSTPIATTVLELEHVKTERFNKVVDALEFLCKELDPILREAVAVLTTVMQSMKSTPHERFKSD